LKNNLKKINIEIKTQKKRPYGFRKATLLDVKSIQALVNDYASKDKMLPLSFHDIFESLRDFHVCICSNNVIGVCALHITWKDLAEIRSLAVADKFQENGIASMLVRKCLAEARRLGVKEVFALTYCPGFFEKFGFVTVDKAKLPHKVWADCIRCHHFPDCNEVAVKRKL